MVKYPVADPEADVHHEHVEELVPHPVAVMPVHVYSSFISDREKSPPVARKFVHVGATRTKLPLFVLRAKTGVEAENPNCPGTVEMQGRACVAAIAHVVWHPSDANPRLFDVSAWQ